MANKLPPVHQNFQDAAETIFEGAEVKFYPMGEHQGRLGIVIPDPKKPESKKSTKEVNIRFVHNDSPQAETLLTVFFNGKTLKGKPKLSRLATHIFERESEIGKLSPFNYDQQRIQILSPLENSATQILEAVKETLTPVRK